MVTSRPRLRAAAGAATTETASGARRTTTLPRADRDLLGPDGRLRIEALPGRWNPRRGLPPELDPLCEAVAIALARAGWWSPGSAEPLDGGLVVAVDGAPLLAAVEFASAVEAAGGRARPGPSAFLHALPSTAASVLGLLFGLRDYQATLVGDGLCGVRALSHACDLLIHGRLARVVVAALGVGVGDVDGERLRLASALALEPVPSGGGDAPDDLRVEVELRVSVPDAPRRREDARPSRRGRTSAALASWPLHRIAAWLDERPPEARRGGHGFELEQLVPETGEVGAISIHEAAFEDVMHASD